MMALLGLMLLLVDTSVAARKLPKRPAVKPLKTFPRNNATPIPPTGAGSGVATPNGSELPKPLSVEPAEAIAASPPGSIGDSSGASAAAPVPPAAASAAAAAVAETKADDLDPTPMATPSGSSSVDEDCEPDMIGFELITG